MTSDRSKNANRFSGGPRRAGQLSGLLLILLVLVCGCAGPRREAAVCARPFEFQKDTFAFANELVWVYGYDVNGKWTARQREPKPDYTHHCFVVARAVRQFYTAARFDPGQPPADAKTNRRLVRRVLSTNPRRVLPECRKVVIPGYADLRSFSEAEERLLKSEAGGAWHSYFQRGHWRMVFPFSRRHQGRTAEQLLETVRGPRPPVLHLVRFPQLTINHAVVAFDARVNERQIEFAIYDPNDPKQPGTLTYDRANRTFTLPANEYFPGGRVDVYEVYHRWNY